jgi:hypothetical protein
MKLITLTAAVSLVTASLATPPAFAQSTTSAGAQAQNPETTTQQPAAIEVTATLSIAQKSRKIAANDFHPSTSQPSIRTGNFAEPVTVQFVLCEQGKRTPAGMTLDATASTIVKASNRTEINTTVNFPMVSPDWIAQQNSYASGGGCGYFKEPKIIVLTAKGTVPFQHLDPQYTFTGDSDGYTLKVEVKPSNK